MADGRRGHAELRLGENPPTTLDHTKPLITAASAFRIDDPAAPMMADYAGKSAGSNAPGAKLTVVAQSSEPHIE